MINLQRILATSLVTLGMLSVAVSVRAAEKARSYDVTLNSDVKVGTQVLPKGDYKVTLEGSNALFTKHGSSHNKAPFSAPAKLEAGNTKFDHTTMHLVMEGGQPRISFIELKGSKELLRLD